MTGDPLKLCSPGTTAMLELILASRLCLTHEHRKGKQSELRRDQGCSGGTDTWGDLEKGAGLGGSAPEYCALFHLAFGTCVLILITELRSCGLCCNNFHLEQLLDCILLSREHLTGFWVASEKAFVHFCGYWTCSLLQDCAAASGIISCYPRILWECYSSFSVQIPSFEGWALPCQVKGPHHQQTLHFIILLASGQCFSPY